MKLIAPFLIVLCLCMSCNQKESQPSKVGKMETDIPLVEKIQYRDISTDEMQSVYGSEDYVIIDVRTPEEIAKGMIDGAQHIDFVGKDFKDQIKQLDRNENYIVYCRSGGRSTKACQFMQKQGFKKVANLEGGYLAYTDSQ